MHLAPHILRHCVSLRLAGSSFHLWHFGCVFSLRSSFSSLFSLFSSPPSLLSLLLLSDNAYKDPHIRGDPSHTLYVGRLDTSTSEDRLREIFGEYGRISNIRLVRDAGTCVSAFLWAEMCFFLVYLLFWHLVYARLDAWA